MRLIVTTPSFNTKSFRFPEGSLYLLLNLKIDFR